MGRSGRRRVEPLRDGSNSRPSGPRPPATTGYPLEFDVEYPDRDLNRLSSALRIFWVIPIAIVLGLVGHTSFTASSGETLRRVRLGRRAAGRRPARDDPVPAEVPAVVVRLEPRVPAVYEPRVRLWGASERRLPVHRRAPVRQARAALPDAKQELNRWLPLVKWLLAIPHFIVLFFLYIGAFFAVIFAWFAIVFTGRYPRGVFDYVVGVMRWGNRVTAYAVLMATDQYPPFSLD